MVCSSKCTTGQITLKVHFKTIIKKSKFVKTTFFWPNILVLEAALNVCNNSGPN